MTVGDHPGGRGSDDRDASESVWSSDEIPVREEPLDIVWAPRTGNDSSQRTPPTREPEDSLNPDEDGPGRVGAGLSRRSKWIGAGAALLVGAVAVGSLTRPGGDRGSTSPSSTLDSSTSEPSGASTTAATIAPATTTPSTGDVPTRIELPDAVAAILSPTEIVMYTDDGRMRTLSLPSGSVRSVAIADSTGPGGFGGNGIMVSPDAAAVATSDNQLLIVPRNGPPITVASSEFADDAAGIGTTGWQVGADGTSEFVVVTFPNSGGQGSLFSVSLDGDVTPLGVTSSSSFYQVATSEGGRIDNDAGGAYTIAADGTSQRIDDGFVYAAGGDHRLVRQCDESQRCNTVLVTVSTGERSVLDPATIPADFASMTYGMWLSPDGTAVSMLRSASTNERVIVEFGRGEVAAAPTPQGWGQGSTWAPDSSGVFDIGASNRGLQFTGRDGDTVAFGEDLGTILAIGVRTPAAELDSTATVVTTTIGAARATNPTGLRLVAASRAGGMAFVDVDAGTMQSWETSRLLGQGPSAALLTLADSVVALPASNDPAFVVRPGTDAETSAALAVDGDKLPGPTEGTVWVPVDDPTRTHLAFRLVDVGSGEEQPGAIDLPNARLLGADGRGGIVVRANGDVFAVGVAGSERLTSGELLAVNASTAYVRECSDVATCTLVRVDRSTASRRDVAIAGFDVMDGVAVAGPNGAALATSVSPDGTVFLVELAAAPDDAGGDVSGDPRYLLVDTTAGRTTVIAGFNAAQPIVWNADSTFAALLSGESTHSLNMAITVFDRASDTFEQLTTPPMRAIAAAPTGW
jgi:hypothetical protein